MSLWLTLTSFAVAETPAAAIAPIREEALRALITEASGQTRVLNFWATWCGPCVAELPLLRDWARAHPEVEVVLINVDLPSLRGSKVVSFLGEHGVGGLRNLQLDSPDPAASLARAVPSWPDVLPVTVVVNARGKRVAAFSEAVTAEGLSAALPKTR